MKAILISIKPEWVVKILNGEKTIEIRKTMPKCDLPIDVYIYCTKSNYFGYISKRYIGKVVAKFTLNKVEEITNRYCKGLLVDSCLKNYELNEYLGNNNGYAWHIDNLVIFDKPKELNDFYKFGVDDWAKKHAGTEIGYLEFWNGIDDFRLTKAPQSWCYVEDLL